MYFLAINQNGEKIIELENVEIENLNNGTRFAIYNEDITKKTNKNRLLTFTKGSNITIIETKTKSDATKLLQNI